MTASLDIVIVNWNTGERLARCVDSVRRASREGFELGRVVVVDNASTDGSADALDDTGLPLVLVRNSGNRGFAAGCNQGAAGSSSAYILFLNPDTVLSSGSLELPVAFMERPGNGECGVVGISLVGDDGLVDRSCARFPTPASCMIRVLGLDRLFPARFPGYFMRDWDHGRSMRVDHVTGAFYLVRRPLFVETGGFDERFFVYLEDVDLSRRINAAGRYCWFMTEASAYHRGGGASEHDRARRLFYAVASRICYARKHFDPLPAAAILLASLTLEPAVRFVFALAGGRVAQLRETCAAYGRIWRELPLGYDGRRFHE